MYITERPTGTILIIKFSPFAWFSFNRNHFAINANCRFIKRYNKMQVCGVYTNSTADIITIMFYVKSSTFYTNTFNPKPNSLKLLATPDYKNTKIYELPVANIHNVLLPFLPCGNWCLVVLLPRGNSI